MKIFSYFLIISIIFVTIKTTAQIEMKKIKLMPFPKSVQLDDDKFRIDEKIILSFNIEGKRIESVSNRFLARLAKRTGLFYLHPFAYLMNDSANIKILCDKVEDVKLGIDESYNLEVTQNNIFLKSKTDIGAIRGFETLLQLLQSDEEGFYFPQIKIDDEPRFVWRGLMIDACRHFMPVDVIKRNLDAMAAVKMNVFHWHLSEDQGFRVECKTFPKLHELGSDGLYYSHAQIKDIINYADERGIRVIPEFDIPGHSTSWLVGYPELGSVPGPYKIERKFGIKNPTFNPTIEETYQFFDKFFEEMAELFPDEYIHIGGDENNGKHWDKNDEIQEFMIKNNLNDNNELQAYFNKRILAILKKHNKKMIGWDEILHDKIPKDIVIQSWRGKKALIESAQKGYQGILSNGYYIDLVQPTEFHYLNDPVLDDAKLTIEEESRILGGEATMWSEWVTPENVDSRIWPRTAAIAERFWSPKTTTNLENMFERLEKISLQLEDHGLTHISFQEKMMRRLTNGYNTKSLKILLDVIEPLKEYKRASNASEKGFQFTQQSAYTRVLDATIVDPKVARIFRNLVDNVTESDFEDLTKVEKLKEQLMIWEDNHEELLPIISNSPILFEIEPLSEMLSKISRFGLEIIDLKINNSESSSVWIERKKELLRKAKEPIAQTELMIISAIEKLFNTIN